MSDQIKYLILLLLIICYNNLLSGDNENPSIVITWDNSNQTTYNHPGGKVTGKDLFISFTVSSGSGNLTISSEVIGAPCTLKSFTGDVVESKTYLLKVSIVNNGTKICTSQDNDLIIFLTDGNEQSRIVSYRCDSNEITSDFSTIGELSFDVLPEL